MTANTTDNMDKQPATSIGDFNARAAAALEVANILMQASVVSGDTADRLVYRQLSQAFGDLSAVYKSGNQVDEGKKWRTIGGIIQKRPKDAVLKDAIV